MSLRKIDRKRIRAQRRGLMIVHARWLSLDGITTPERWLAWERRLHGDV